MRHKTWFRLVIKAVGVLLIGVSLPFVGNFLGAILSYAFIEPVGTIWGEHWGIQALYSLGTLAQFAFGLYLFFGGKWIVNMAIPSNRPYCPECGYDLRDAKSDRCAECGVTLPHAQTRANESLG